MKNKKVSMQDIADRLGITKVSVSKALNNQPGVSDELKKRIIKVAYELDYFNGKKNRLTRLNKFAFFVHKKYFFESENFYTQIYYYLNKECVSRNISLSLYVISPEEEKNIIIPSMLNKDTYNGIFLAGEFDESYLYALSNLTIPMVSVDCFKPHIKIDSVVADNFNLSYSATVYLIDNGHRKIGFAGDPRQASSYLDRYFGFQKALASYNIKFNNEWNINNFDPATNYYTMDIELPHDMPTAFICQCDMSAYFLVKKLQSKGYKVPHDVSIVSFDNTDISVACNPPLTTIDINKKEFALKAFELMISRIKEPDAQPEILYIRTKLIERESVRNISKV